MKVFLEQERDSAELEAATGVLFHRRLLEARVWHGAELEMEEDLLAYLVAHPSVAAALGDRLTFGARPQDEPLPCATLNRITGRRDYHQQGGSGLVESLVQIDVWAETWLAAKDAGTAIAEALSLLS